MSGKDCTRNAISKSSLEESELNSSRKKAVCVDPHSTPHGSPILQGNLTGDVSDIAHYTDTVIREDEKVIVDDIKSLIGTPSSDKEDVDVDKNEAPVGTLLTNIDEQSTDYTKPNSSEWPMRLGAARYMRYTDHVDTEKYDSSEYDSGDVGDIAHYTNTVIREDGKVVVDDIKSLIGTPSADKEDVDVDKNDTPMGNTAN
ncbi:unnamed protein product [Calypogeia fissa]